MSIHSYRSTHMIHVPVAVHLRKNKVPEAFTQSLRVFISRDKNTTEFTGVADIQEQACFRLLVCF